MGVLPIALAIGFIILTLYVSFWSRHQRQEDLTRTWSALAEATGLQFLGVDLDFWGSSRSPGVSGQYRGRQIAVSRIVEQHDAYEGSIPVVYTRIVADVDNGAECRLTLASACFLDRIFNHERSSSGDEYFDQRFKVSGQPDVFIRKAIRALASHYELFQKPDGVIQRTDYPLSWVSWSAPTIRLDGLQLTCMQSGVPTHIPHQVALLDLLCDLADLAEQS